MKSLVKYACLFLIFFTFVFCGRANKGNLDEYESTESADATASYSTLNKEVSPEAPDRKFIRSADLKFKVKDVAKATDVIENITAKMGGFVANTNLSSTIDNTNTTTISADSVLETTYFTVGNEMVLRVPNTRLDTTLKAIAGLVEYLDYRKIKSDDVALQLLATEVKQNRLKNHEARLTKAINNRGKRLKETAAAEDDLLQKQKANDDARLTNLHLKDQVNFSTISLTIYQRPSVAQVLLPNPKNIAEYEPGFGLKMVDAILFGWNILEGFIVFLTRLWGVFLFVLLGWLLLRKYGLGIKNFPS